MISSVSKEQGQNLPDEVVWENWLNILPTLDQDRVGQLTKIAVANGGVDNLSLNTEIQIGSNLTPQILITGMPHLGKTTTIKKASDNLKNLGINHAFITERDVGFPKDFDDEYGMFFYNLALSSNGLSVLLNHFHGSTLTLFDRGLIDHLVFADSLEKYYEDIYKSKPYGNLLPDYRNWIRHFIPEVDGIIICNSSPEISQEYGSKLPINFLRRLNEGFKIFPETISNMKPRPYPLTLTINIDFDNEENPNDLLEKSINTLINWNVTGKIIS